MHWLFRGMFSRVNCARQSPAAVLPIIVVRASRRKPWSACFASLHEFSRQLLHQATKWLVMFVSCSWCDCCWRSPIVLCPEFTLTLGHMTLNSCWLCTRWVHTNFPKNRLMKPYVSFSPLRCSRQDGRLHASCLSLLHGSRCHHESAVDGRGHLPLHRGLLRPAALHPLHLTEEVWKNVC